MKGRLILLQVLLAIFLNKFDTTQGKFSEKKTRQILRSVTLPTGYVAYPGHNVAYKLYTEKKLWTQARDQCISDGGHLAIIDTIEKFEFIQNLVIIDKELALIGIQKPAGADAWIRVDNGLPVRSVPWYTYDGEAYDENCGIAVFSKKGFLKKRCTWRERFLCEIPIGEEEIDDEINLRSSYQATIKADKPTSPIASVSYKDKKLSEIGTTEEYSWTNDGFSTEIPTDSSTGETDEPTSTVASVSYDDKEFSEIVTTEDYSWTNDGFSTERPTDSSMGEFTVPRLLMRAVTLPHGYSEFPDFDIAYKIHEEYLTYDESRARCIAEGGRLAIIDSIAKNNIITGMTRTGPMYVGIRLNTANSDGWVRDLDGLPVATIPWAPNNPHPMRCAVLRYDGSGLEDTSCSERLQFVCEIPLEIY